MNMNSLQTLLLCLLMGTCFVLQGQTGQFVNTDEALAVVEPTTKSKTNKTQPVSSAARFHKRFPQLFTGMAIEIAKSDYPMDKTDPLFRQFGNVLYEKLPDGGYSYLIMANFSSKEAALEFLQKVVKPKTEKALLIQYDEGNRKVVRE